jgi:hypothetical protein
MVLKLVVSILTVLPTVPVADTDDVTKIYLVVPAEIVLDNPETLRVEPLVTDDKVEPNCVAPEMEEALLLNQNLKLVKLFPKTKC